MKKLSKIILLSLFIALVCGGVALSLCYLIIPERTKYAIDVLVGYLNTPFCIGFGISITGSVILYVIIKMLIKYALDNSKYGKQELTELKKALEQIEIKAKEYKEKAEELDSVVNAYLSDFNARIDYLADYLSKVCETSPNAKIKALGSELVSAYKDKKEDLSKELDLIKTDYDKYTKENKSVDELYAKLKELESKVMSYGKREETIND